MATIPVVLPSLVFVLAVFGRSMVTPLESFARGLGEFRRALKEFEDRLGR